jgi:hypothetical protein
MTEIGYRGGTKSALGLHDEETVLAHYVKGHLDVLAAYVVTPKKIKSLNLV